MYATIIIFSRIRSLVSQGAVAPSRCATPSMLAASSLDNVTKYKRYAEDVTNISGMTKRRGARAHTAANKSQINLHTSNIYIKCPLFRKPEENNGKQICTEKCRRQKY